MSQGLRSQRTPRWLDSASDAPTEVRTLLEAVSRDENDDARLRRLEASLGPLLGNPLRPQINSAGSRSRLSGVSRIRFGGKVTASSGWIAKLAAAKILGVFVAGGITGGGVFAALSAHHQRSTAQVSGSAAPQRPSTRHVPSSSSAPSDEGSRVATDPGSAPPFQNGPTRELREGFGTSQPEHSDVSASPHGTEAPALIASATPPIRPVASPASIAEEASLLQDARRVLLTSPVRALELLSEHALRFPTSTLTEERELFAIEALARSGRTGAANRRLSQLRAQHPSSPHLEQAARAVANAGPLR